MLNYKAGKKDSDCRPKAKTEYDETSRNVQI